MHSDIVLKNVLLKDNIVISQPWIAPLEVAWWRSPGSWGGWVCLGVHESALSALGAAWLWVAKRICTRL